LEKRTVKKGRDECVVREEARTVSVLVHSVGSREGALEGGNSAI